jgi:N-methylhydantoinase B/oxoprolinase/acetone carboxylase alpha subunit
MTPFDPITLEIMWSRLVSIADEMWTTVLRTAVSTIIGAAQDFGCEILDAQGNSVAHSQRSMPVFNLVMPTTTRAVMECFPPAAMRPGDIYITNDPWICAGHLDDIAIVSPVFLPDAPGPDDRPVAFLTTIAHTTSIGGSLSPTTVRDAYEEGLRIPLCKLYDAGQPNDVVLAFIRDNVRTPEMVLTDIEAQVTANGLGAERVRSFLREYGLADLEAVSAAVQERAEGAMRAAIRAIPNGIYENEVFADGRGEPVRLRCRITVSDEEIHVDYRGTDAQRMAGGINCCMIYTAAHTVYPLKCVLTPAVPANEGTYRPLHATAPAGSILNCTFPASVNSRVNTGWHLHSLIFGALADVLPERVQAGNGLMHSLNCYGHDAAGRTYNAHFFTAGGRGASQGRDGIGRNCFPSSARNVAVEHFEMRVPVLVRQRALRPDSAGAGQWRGAFGHDLVFSRLPGFPKPVDLFFSPNRLRYPPPGLAGGEDGPRTAIFFNGRQLTEEELQSGHVALTTDDDRLTEWLPGGAGVGDPTRRDPAAIATDARSGLVTLAPTPERVAD